MRCPKCGLRLQEVKYKRIDVDVCFACNGIFLDQGELEHIVKQRAAAAWSRPSSTGSRARPSPSRAAMALTLDEVRRVAALARLKLSAEEEQLFAGQLSAILDHVRELEALDVSGVPPMTHALAEGEAVALRPDALVPGLSPEEALANAPAREGTCFKVPRIIE